MLKYSRCINNAKEMVFEKKFLESVLKKLEILQLKMKTFIKSCVSCETAFNKLSETKSSSRKKKMRCLAAEKRENVSVERKTNMTPNVEMLRFPLAALEACDFSRKSGKIVKSRGSL